MGQVRRSIYVAVPVEDVFDFVADYRHAREYLHGFTRFEPVGPSSRGLGAKVYAAGRFHGMSVHTYLEIVEFVKNRKIVSRSSPTIRGLATWLFEPKNGGTRVTFASDFRLPVPVIGSVLGGLVLEEEVVRHVEESLRRLKRVLESRYVSKRSTEGDATQSRSTSGE